MPAPRKTWVLDTETKGTGAQMVPLDRVERGPEPGPRRIWVPPKRRPREPEPPPPRPPRRFRVVDVSTGRALADGADLRTTLAVLGEVRAEHDVRVYVHEADGDRWRLLSMAEQDALWRRRIPGGPPPAA